MKLKALFAISSGEYSDYRVLAVTDDEKTAEAWAAALRDDDEGWQRDARIEALDFIPAGTAPFRFTSWSFDVELWDDGREGEQRLLSCTELAVGSSFGAPPSRPSVRKVRAPVHQNAGGRLEVRGASEKSVRKVAHEQTLMWRAAEPKRAFWG